MAARQRSDDHHVELDEQEYWLGWGRRARCVVTSAVWDGSWSTEVDDSVAFERIDHGAVGLGGSSGSRHGVHPGRAVTHRDRP